MWSFKLPDGTETSTNLQWKYVPYIEELRAWVLESWDVGNKITDVRDQTDAKEDFPTWEDMTQKLTQRNKEN